MKHVMSTWLTNEAKLKHVMSTWLTNEANVGKSVNNRVMNVEHINQLRFEVHKHSLREMIRICGTS